MANLPRDRLEGATICGLTITIRRPDDGLMLDEANRNFVNGVVTVIRYGVYLWIAIAVLAISVWMLTCLWAVVSRGIEAVGAVLKPVFAPAAWIIRACRRVLDRLGMPRQSAIEKARRRMRDLGY